MIPSLKDIVKIHEITYIKHLIMTDINIVIMLTIILIFLRVYKNSKCHIFFSKTIPQLCKCLHCIIHTDHLRLHNRWRKRADLPKNLFHISPSIPSLVFRRRKWKYWNVKEKIIVFFFLLSVLHMQLSFKIKESAFKIHVWILMFSVHKEKCSSWQDYAHPSRS